MGKDKKRVPSALRHGIYSTIGLLPTEDPAEFEKFKQEICDDYKPVGRSEKIIVEEIAGLQWRLQHLSTFGMAMRAQDRRSAIYSKLPASGWYPRLVGYEEPEPDPRSPEELEALRKSVEKQSRTELGAAMSRPSNIWRKNSASETDYMERSRDWKNGCCFCAGSNLSRHRARPHHLRRFSRRQNSYARHRELQILRIGAALSLGLQPKLRGVFVEHACL